MTRVLYDILLAGHLAPAGYYLTDEAKEYLATHLDMADEAAVRHVIRHTLAPAYAVAGEREAREVKDLLEWYLNCATEERCKRFLASDPEWPVANTNPPRLFFQWWWRELFGDEDWHSDRLCGADLYEHDPPDGVHGQIEWPPPIDPEVLRFPRRDGKPPGAGAPAQVNRSQT